MRPFCSRNRSPSARNRKSNLARSAVRAKWANELNSMWLPDLGSLHTVVLFTPGKCAARCTCLTGLPSVMPLVISVSPSGGRRYGRVTVRGTLEAEQSAQRVGLVLPAEEPAPLQLRDEVAGDGVEVGGN